MTSSDPSPFKAHLEDAWFGATPSPACTAGVAGTWRRLWQHNALQALQAAGEGLGQPLPRLLAAVQAHDLSKRLEPRLFARLAALMEAMQRGDGYAVSDLVQQWLLDPPASWSNTHLRSESIAAHPWEAPLLHEVRVTRVQNVAPLTLFPLLEQDAAPFHAAATQALELIGQVDPAMHGEIEAHLSLIKLFVGPGVEGFSSPKAFGAIWLQAPQSGNELAWFLEHLVHEVSHLHLNALLVFDPLLRNPNELHRAPIRPDPRPLFQVLHGTFVLARNCRVHRLLVERWPELRLEAALRGFQEQLLRGVEVLNEVMQPTPRGQLLLKSLQQQAASL